MRVFINPEQFLFIENMKGVSAQQFADHCGIGLRSAQTWLSRWKTRGYLLHTPWTKAGKSDKPGRPEYSSGIYKLNPDKWWGELASDTERIEMVSLNVENLQEAFVPMTERTRDHGHAE